MKTEQEETGMTPEQTTKIVHITQEIIRERWAQHARWGEQNHPDGTGSEEFREVANKARAYCQDAFAEGRGAWSHILNEEFCEALAERDRMKLRQELIQVAAVAVAWVEKIDREIGGAGIP